jgi:hypothetical protein
MAQPPLLTDQVQIEPGTTTYGTRVIDREPTDGSIRFADPSVTALLSALVGVRNITGLFIVGRAGDGAPYTTIQDAIDAIPDTSSPSAPSLVLIGAGEYSENLVIDKDGVYLVGQGGVRLTNAAADATVTISDAAATTPENVVLRDLYIENTDPAEEVILISGAGTYASGTATVGAAPLAAGDTLTIGGTVLTGVSGARTSGSDDFSVDGGTVEAIAVEIAAAINDSANSFAATVVAAANAAVVTITAVTPGAVGNTITLASSTTPPGNLLVSGATLTGGGSAGSPVAAGEILIQNCQLVASGVAGFQIRADTVNHIRVLGGSWRGSSSNSLAYINQCASFRLFGVEWVNDLELAYDTGNDQPLDPTSAYQVGHCDRVGDVLSNQVGEGSLSISHCSLVGTVGAGGDRALTVTHSNTGDLTLSDTVVATYTESTRGTIATAIGTPTLAESMASGSVVFAASSAEPVVFLVEQPDIAYAVYVDGPSPGWASAQTATGFIINFSVLATGLVRYTVVRQM